jgi:radical SAM superfamily enzyme YgiQ (UPF0313 family)
MRVALINTYELGHQPFGIASPAAWLAARGAEVACMDLSREPLDEQAVREARLIALYVPMHTATRLAIALLERVKSLNPRAHICFYGLYAPVNEAHLRSLGAQTILGGECEEGLATLVERLAAANGNSREPDEKLSRSSQSESVISLNRQKFILPQRAGLPKLAKYSQLVMPDGSCRIAGYTEASRGCKHLCRHCPIVPVYNGTFRIVDREIVLDDIRQQVAAGAEHISFGDPDFFNGPTHAIAIVEQFHRDFPSLGYDVVIKIEHLLKHANLLPMLRDTGCLFVTSAVESVDDHILARLDKGHTRTDFLRAITLTRQANLHFHPTFVPFTPWTTLDGYCDLLEVLAENELIASVAPIQLAIRLLIPAGSRLLDLPDTKEHIEAFDSAALVYPWQHRDEKVDALTQEITKIVERGEKFNRSRAQIFHKIAKAAFDAAKIEPRNPDFFAILETCENSTAAVPHFDEPWYCCAEPSSDQLVGIQDIGPGAAAQGGRTPGRDAFV